MTGAFPHSEWVYLTGNLSEPLLMLPFLKQAVRPSGRLTTFRGLLWLLAGTAVAAALAGVLVTAGLFAVGADWAGATSWLGWLSGDALGLMLVAPLLLQARPIRGLWSSGGPWEQSGLWISLLFGLGLLQFTHALSGLIVVVLVLISIRLDASAASLAALVTAVLIVEHALGNGFSVAVGGTGTLDVRALLILVAVAVQLTALSTQDRRDALEAAQIAHADLQRSNALLSAVLHSAPVGVALYDVVRTESDSRIRFINRFMNELGAGGDASDSSSFVGRELGDYYPEFVESGLYKQLVRAWAEGIRVEFLVDSEASLSRWTGVYANSVVPLPGNQVLVTWSDVTNLSRAHQATEEALLRAEELEQVLRTALDAGMDAFAIYEQSAAGAWFASYVNPVGAARSGSDPEQLLGAPPELMIPVEAVDHVIPLMRKAHFSGEPQNIRADLTGSQTGWRGDFDVLVTPTTDGRLIVTWRDVSEIQEAQRSLRSAHASAMHAATHDPLTGVPNRVLLRDRIGTALAHLRRHQTRCALVFVDLDNFKVVNDRFGHAIGDAVLRGVASRLATLVRDGDTVSRISGDEFVLVLTDLTDEWELAPFEARILEQFERALEVEGRTLHVSASIGVVVVEDAREDADALLAMADLAMYRSKQDGKSRVTQYSETLGVRSLPGRAKASEVEGALRRGEIVAWYQPVFSAESLQPSGFEALARWQHPEFGLLAPGQFLDLFETSGRLPDLGQQVLVQAIATLSKLEVDQSVAVNVAAVQVMNRHFSDAVLSACEHELVTPARLVLELTEAQMLEAGPDVLRSLARLRDEGVRIAIDDFGAGFSSFAYLQNFSFDILKLDKALIESELNDRTDAIIGSVVRMARELGVATTAEGVERPEQLEVVRRAGVDYVQGYLLGRPREMR